MGNTKEYQSRDLRIHRKYVLVISFVLIFLRSGGVTIEKINFLGASFVFENINAIYWALWVLLFYSLLRYWQYYITYSTGEGYWKPYYAYRELLFMPTVKRIINEQDPIPVEELHINKRSYPNFNHLESKSKWVKGHYTGDQVVDSTGITIKANGVEVEFHMIKDFGWLYIKLWILFLFNRPAIFEFLFPFIFGIGTIIYCNWSDWPGSLINLLC